jgi:phospholipid/cholesterol/gamma-HCH transport system substrate-binding protein
MRSPHFARHVVIGVVYLVVLAMLMTLAVLVYNKSFTTTTDVALVAPDAGTALQSGADVEVRGVVVGSVGDITTNGREARIELKLEPGQAAGLPANVSAELLPKTLFGQRYVDLVLPATPSGAHLRGGDVIRPSGPAPTDLQDLFAKLLPVLQAVRPAQLAATLGALATSLRGEGSNLGDQIRVFAHYLHRFAPKVPKLLDDLSALRRVAANYTAASPDLIAALRNFTVSSRTLAERQAQFTALVRSVTSASDRLGSFLQANSPDIITLSRASLPTLRVLQRYSPEFPCLSRTLVDFVPVMNAALGKGTHEPGLHITARVVPPRQPYRPGTDTPVYRAGGGPRCPQVAPGTVDATAYGAALSRTAGIGTDNSPQENEVIAELEAGAAHTTPAAFPKWGSLLLGPALRGTAVTVR